MVRGHVTRRGHRVPHVRWRGCTPGLSVVAGRGCRTPYIPSPNNILFSDDTVYPEVTDTLTKLLDHRFAHQAYPPEAFANLALPGPVQFTFVVFNIRLMLLIRREITSGNSRPRRWEMPHQNGDAEVLRGEV